MDERTFQTLELDALIDLLARHVQSPLGRGRALSLKPSTDLGEINRALDLTSEACDYLSAGGAFALGEISDPAPALAELQVEGTSLDAQQILGLQRLIAAAMDSREQFAGAETKARHPNLAAVAARIPDLRRVLAALRGKILPNGEIDDNASPELRRIRREITDRRTRIYRNLEALMHTQAPTAIQEDFVTIRNGRFVIPVRTDSRAKVAGVMHGLSSSGQTTYVEPLGVIDQNNEMVRLREEEEIEIAQILFSMSETLRVNLAGIHTLVDAVAELDFDQAKARLSLEFDCARPRMTSGKGIALSAARHPLLEHMLRQSGGKVVPISLDIEERHRSMVISGPNAGGKTVVLKTVGLAALMAQMGLHVAASSAELAVFNAVLADIGDQQSIAANLSTFTAHMRNIAEIAAKVRPPTLVLLDEVGTGTDPDEGAALAIAIVDHFRTAAATTVASTHYNPLKMWASQQADVLNASVEFDERTLKPTYRLVVGVAGASSGIEIARRMNLPPAMLAAAGELIDPAHVQASEYLKQLKSLVDEQEALRTALEDERQTTAEKYTRLDLDFARREADRQAEFERQLSQVLREFNDESARLISAIKDKVIAARIRKEAENRAGALRASAAVRLRKQAAAATVGPAPVDASVDPRGAHAALGAAVSPLAEAALGESEAIHERDRVRIKSFGQEGIVETIDNGVFTVLAGSLRFRARRDELQLLTKAEPASKRSALLPNRVSADVDVDANFASEVNVIGTTVDEATDRVDKFLDEAYMAGVETVRIVHGHGKGALRRAVSELLTGHPHVAGFRPAPANEGGAGATVADLKK